MKKLVHGVGVNDANYPVSHINAHGKRTVCPFYRVWNDMLARGYSQRVKEKKPTYRDVSVCKEWHRFSNFKAWMEKQPWENMHLDKDLKCLGSRVYSPENCCFIPPKINTLLLTCSSKRGSYPIGVSKDKIASDMVNFLANPYRAGVQTLSGKRVYIGMYASPFDAHVAWQKAKITVIEDYINWWQFSPEVNHSFNQEVVMSLIGVAEKIEKDIRDGLETYSYF